jgi:acetate kinase
MKILVINLGSTSFKFKIIDTDSESVLSEGLIDRIGSPLSTVSIKKMGDGIIEEEREFRNQSEAIEAVFSAVRGIKEVDAVGFKAVHAGETFGPILIDEALITEMEKFNSAAPAHNPHYISAMKKLGQILPETPLVGVFETGFHRSIPDYAFTYSIPYEWYEKYGIRRYGFHGASLTYVSEKIREHVPNEKKNKYVLCHLGGSSSICAVLNGKSIDTSMGFTPQAGIPMNNRIGDIDPFVIPFLLDTKREDLKSIFKKFSDESGLLGISGVSKDVRDLEKAALNGDERAELALNVFSYAVQKYIGSYLVVLGGMDVLAFSGGIGEKGHTMRARICRGLRFMGVELDEDKNKENNGTEAKISSGTSTVDIFIIPTNEELTVAKKTAELLLETQKD